MTPVARVPLFELCRPRQWPTISQGELLTDGFPVYGANGVIGRYSKYNHAYPTILITCRGATCGTVNVCEPESYVTGNAMALDDLDESRVDLRYLVHALTPEELSKTITGSAQPQITRESLRSVTIPLPPLSEQRRISMILDRVNVLRTKRRNAQTQIEGLAQTIFLDMFGSTIRQFDAHARTSLKAMSSLITKGTTPTSVGLRFSDSGVPFLRVQNLVDGALDFSAGRLFIDVATHAALKRSRILSGDVLVSIAGTIGRSAIVPTDSPEMNCNQAVAIVRLRDDVDGTFIRSWLGTTDATRQVSASAVTGTISNLSLAQLGGLMVPVVPLQQQRLFSRRIAAVESIKKTGAKHRAELDVLFDSLHARAFSGRF